MGRPKKQQAPQVHKIHPQLLPLAVAVDQLVLDPRNARAHDDPGIAVLVNSLREYGQRKPVVVQSGSMVVRAGNGLVMAARQLGWTHVASVVVDEADVQATAYALVDNKSAELSSWDWVVLEETLRELAKEPTVDLQALGWSQPELDGLVMAAQWDSLEAERLGSAGDRTRVDRGTLTLKFTDEQHKILQAQAIAAGLGDQITPELVIQLVQGRA